MYFQAGAMFAWGIMFSVLWKKLAITKNKALFSWYNGLYIYFILDVISFFSVEICGKKGILDDN